MHKPRHYQQACHDAVIAALRAGVTRQLFVLPTGSGKTFVFSMIVRTVMEKDRRPALVLAHQDNLLYAAAKEMSAHLPWAMIDIEMADAKARPTANVVCGSMQTLGRKGCTRLSWLESGPSVIIVDEAHRAAIGASYEYIVDRFGGFDGRAGLTLGCTATAARLDNKSLTGAHRGEAIFQQQTYEYKLSQAVSEGFLCPIRGYRVETDVDLTKVHTLAGDYNQGELAKAVNTAPRTRAAVKHWKEVAPNRITAVFCTNLDHARAAAAEWSAAGYRATYVDGEMDRQERNDRIRMWRTGETQVMCSCNVLLEGFDYRNISCVVMLRPTQSWVLYCQAIGRGTRICDGKDDLIVIDVADNTGKHNLSHPPISLPRAVGIDRDVNLDGGDVLKAKAEYDSFAEGGRIPDDFTGTMRELRTRIQEVSLIEQCKLPSEVEALSQLAWTKLSRGAYVIGGGRWVSGLQQKWFFSEDALGKWSVTWNEAVGEPSPWSAPCGESIPSPKFGLVPPFAIADRIVLGMVTSRNCVMRDAGWRNADIPATDKQITFLSRHYTPQQVAGLSKGQATKLIADIINGNKPAQASAKLARSVFQKTGARPW